MEISYFFDVVPERDQNFLVIFFLIFLSAFMISLFNKKKLRQNRQNPAFTKLFKKFPSKIQIISFIGLLLLPARYVEIPFIAMRSIFFFLTLLMVYVFIRHFHLYKKIFPLEEARFKKRQEQNKYLPGKRK